jgi:methyl-accepting chemotaxis protein
MFKNLKLTQKVIFTMLIPIIGIIVIAGSSYTGLNTIGEEIEEIAEYQIPINKSILELEKDILKEEVLTYELIIESKNLQSKEFDSVKARIHHLEDETIAIIKELKLLIQDAELHNHQDKIKDIYKSLFSKVTIIEENQQKFKNDLKNFIKDIEAGHHDKLDHEREILKDDLSIMDKELGSLTSILNDLLYKSTHQAKADEERILLIIEIISLIVIILSILILYLLSKSVKKSISNLQNGLISFFDFLNKKSDKVSILDDSSKDEIGNMAGIINQNITTIEKNIVEDKIFINDVQNLVSTINNGDLTNRLTSATENESLHTLKDNLNIMIETLEDNIGSDINAILEVLNHLSNNNFTHSIPSSKGKVSDSLNQVIKLINEILLKNKRNGLILDKSSTTLLGNVDTLNTSSLNTAASLEETAAAIEEITGNVNSTTSTIAEMSNLANEVTTSAKNGELLANKTNASMDEINKQVTSINDAITVIDQIAFQTNILSLNAAVEAATAGEAGKGFAVVAAEVRNLASRSAEAAKEIKTLVENANVRANEGKKIADDMIRGYEGLNENINKTISLISDVNTAAKEQQLGIEQINDTVNSLDQQTQKNAIVASETKTIAIETSQIAGTIVKEVNEKEFNGKETIEKELNYQEKAPVQPSVQVIKPMKKVVEQNTPSRKKASPSNIITAQKSNDDEWESF